MAGGPLEDIRVVDLSSVVVEILSEIGYGEDRIKAMLESQVTLDGRVAPV